MGNCLQLKRRPTCIIRSKRINKKKAYRFRFYSVIDVLLLAYLIYKKIWLNKGRILNNLFSIEVRFLYIFKSTKQYAKNIP